jgi:hypothetical protein
MNLPVIQVVKIEENEDGSANVELDLDERAVQLLMQEGFESILRAHIQEQENKNV